MSLLDDVEKIVNPGDLYVILEIRDLYTSTGKEEFKDLYQRICAVGPKSNFATRVNHSVGGFYLTGDFALIELEDILIDNAPPCQGTVGSYDLFGCFAWD